MITFYKYFWGVFGPRDLNPSYSANSTVLCVRDILIHAFMAIFLVIILDFPTVFAGGRFWGLKYQYPSLMQSRLAPYKLGREFR